MLNRISRQYRRAVCRVRGFSYMVGVAFCILSISPQAQAQSQGNLSPPRIPQVADTIRSLTRSIPYPNGSIYVSEGLMGGISIGKYRVWEDTNSIWQWQGELSYFYRPFFSGGAGGRIVAGQPGDSLDLVQNQFFLFGRFHHAGIRKAGFLGLALGLDNQVFYQSLDKSEELLPMVKVDWGLGWKPWSWGGLTLGGEASYTLKFSRQPSASLWSIGSYDYEYAVHYVVRPGFSLDILHFVPHLRDVVKGFYFPLEVQLGYWGEDEFVLREGADIAFLAGFHLAY